MNVDDAIWKSWNELLLLAENRDIVLYGRSEDWLPKTLKKVNTQVKYIVDQNPKYHGQKYEDIEIFDTKKLLEEDFRPAPYVIITSSIYHEIYQILVERGFKAGSDFCCCPEFRDYEALSRIKARTEKIIISSSDYLDRGRVRSSSEGGGLFVYDLASCSYEKKAVGVYRQIIKFGEFYAAVEYVKGEVHIYDGEFSLCDVISLGEANFCGIAYSGKHHALAVVNASTDCISIIDLETRLVVDRVAFGEKKKGFHGASSSHHLNDCAIFNGKLYVTMFSVCGRWKLGIFDGGLVEYDLDELSVDPQVLVRDAWMPHSPAIIDNEIAYLDSMRGNLMTTNQYVTAHFDYFARGLDGNGESYFVGASENMYASRIKEQRDRRAVMVNAGFSVYNRSDGIYRFFPFMQNMNIHDVLVAD